MSTTKTFAAALLVSTSVTFAPAFADDRAVPGTQIAAIEAQLPVNTTTDRAAGAVAGEYAARTDRVLSAEEVRARLFGVAPVAETPSAQGNDQDAKLIRDVAGMYDFQHYLALGTLETDTAGAEDFETVAFVADNAPE